MSNPYLPPGCTQDALDRAIEDEPEADYEDEFEQARRRAAIREVLANGITAFDMGARARVDRVMENPWPDDSPLGREWRRGFDSIEERDLNDVGF